MPRLRRSEGGRMKHYLDMRLVKCYRCREMVQYADRIKHGSCRWLCKTCHKQIIARQLRQAKAGHAITLSRCSKSSSVRLTQKHNAIEAALALAVYYRFGVLPERTDRPMADKPAAASEGRSARRSLYYRQLQNDLDWVRERIQAMLARGVIGKAAGKASVPRKGGRRAA